MIDLADNGKQGRPVILKDIAARQQISKRYLEQLATALKNVNLVAATTGRGGGYTLPRSPDEITVTEIVRASIGDINVVGCVANPSLCTRAEGCPSREMWVRLNEAIHSVLESVSLADLQEGCIPPIAELINAAPKPCSSPPNTDSEP